ncbi:T9SS type A sorting domain-containing protein [Flavobacterium lindanitolerans]|uniref:T9SS type A sorting domain-containing protein n=1 Tax=Flavobacterium lindanitolerans TaxID=428988 RepID=UPI0031CE084C
MKKQLLFAGLLFGSVFSVNAQVLQTENFNGMTVGNVSEDITGATPGQGGWSVFSSNGTAPTTGTNAGPTNFQIVASGQGSNGLKMVTTNGNKGGRFMWKDGLDTSWGARTTGNNIIQLEFDFFTGPASTSTTQNGISMYGLDGTETRTIAGFVYVPSTKTLSGVAYLKNGATFGTYLIGLGASSATPIVLADNTWYRIGVAYNTTNGAIIWKGPGFDNVGINAANYAGPFPPVEVDFISATPTTNTASAEHTFDNFVVTATPTVALLSKEDFSFASKLSVYPNPSNGLVTISNDLNSALKSVSLTDLNGRTVKTVELNGDSSAQINISDLSAGVYMMNISSDQGSVIKKIVKN